MNEMQPYHGVFVLRAAGTAPRLLLQALFPQVMVAAGFGPLFAGAVMMAHSLSAIAVILWFPALVRRTSLRSAIVLGGVFSSIGLAAIALHPARLTTLALFSVVGGAGWALMSLRGPQEVVNSRPQHEWRRYMSAISRGPLAAALVVPPIALGLLGTVPWEVLLVAAATLILLAALVGTSSLRAGAENWAPPVLSEPLSLRGSKIAAMVFSGYIAGMFNTHLVIFASQGGRTAAELAGWSALFAIATLLSVTGWTLALQRQLLQPFTSAVAGLAAVTATFSICSPKSAAGLLAAVLWPILSAGLYIEALCCETQKASDAVRSTGHLIILHMLAGAVGALVTGWLVRPQSGYRYAFVVLVLGAACLLGTRLQRGWVERYRGTHPKV